MALAAWLFALSPNLIAHGTLATMELAVLASTTAMLFLFWNFLETGRWRWFWASAAMGGLAFSCKFSTVLFPLLLAVIWWLDNWCRSGCNGSQGLFRVTRKIALGMAGYLLVLLAADFAITGFATLPLSQTTGNHPTINSKFGGMLAGTLARLYETSWPQDWVGLATQAHHQMSGGSELPTGREADDRLEILLFCRAGREAADDLLVTAGGAPRWTAGTSRRTSGATAAARVIGLFLAIVAVGSTRNYGLRYLLPLAPLAIVWISRLAEEVPPVQVS